MGGARGDRGAGHHGEAFWRAASRGHTAVVALLLDRGADGHFFNDGALWNAAYRDHLDAATLLLQRGATAHNDILAAAMQNGHHAIAALLRAHGAA